MSINIEDFLSWKKKVYIEDLFPVEKMHRILELNQIIIKMDINTKVLNLRNGFFFCLLLIFGRSREMILIIQTQVLSNDSSSLKLHNFLLINSFFLY